MPQKNNPANLRLGILQNWSSVLQNYGNSIKQNSNLILIQLNLVNYILNLLFNNKVNLIFKEFWWFNNKINCNIYLQKTSTFNYLLFKKQLSVYLNFWINLNNKINFYFKVNWSDSSALLYLYLYSMSLTSNPQKILNILIIYFTKQLNKLKVIYLISGPCQVVLHGFSIKIKGRFENTKTQMSAINEYKLGLVSSINLKDNVQYLNIPIFTSLGSCSLTVCLFYKIY